MRFDDMEIDLSLSLIFGEEETTVSVYWLGSLRRAHKFVCGEIVYRNQLPDARTFWASPWACNEKIFFLEEKGTTYVIQAGREFKVLAENKLDDGFLSTTAITNNTYIFRGEKGIYCVR